MIPREVRLLMKKEWRQLRASRQAMASSVLMPFLFLVAVPQLLVFASYAGRRSPVDHPPPPEAFGFVADVGHDPGRLAISILPLFVGIAGLTVPTILSIFTVVSERESRTFELLVILPVRVSWVLAAKLLCVVAFTLSVCVPLFSIACVELLVFGLASPVEVLALLAQLTAAISLGAAGALVIGFHSPDFRTAQNVSGFVMLPGIFGSMLVAMLVGGGAARPLALTALYATGAALLFWHAGRQSTFERLLR